MLLFVIACLLCRDRATPAPPEGGEVFPAQKPLASIPLPQHAMRDTNTHIE
jgi:hypothetical protein